jgi:D-alanyl-D-alanine carboxypeptidase
MVQSANDCALALAQHVGGSQAAFVQLMNQKAQSLGMTNTHFYSCHGEPPTPPRKPDEVDVSTARELAILGRALVAAHPEVLQYTATKKRTFREKPLFVMENHNHLLGVVPGVDGLKTGWFRAAGYSLVATAERSGRRIFVVVAGSDGALGKVRDKAATEQITRAFANLPALPPPPPPKPTNVVVAAVEPPTNVAAVAEEPPVEKKAENPWWKKPFVMYTGIGVLAVIGVLIGTLVIRARKQTGASYAMDALPPDIRRK